jgi:hypothetical protein
MAISVLAAGCGSRAVKSGNAVGQMGGGLSAHARAVPQGAEACMMKEALAAPTPGAADKPISDECAKALSSDHLWRRSMVVLSAYSARLDALASGASPESAGRIEATMTGIRGEDWISADTPEEQSARSAAAKLVGQMTAQDDKADFDKTVTDAAPHVKTLCDGVKSYLDAAAKTFADVRSEVEKKRAAKTDRRCATFDNRTVCTSETAVDRVMLASVFGGLALREANHLDARDDVASFCAAHAKLASAVGSGDAGKDETYTGIVDAVKAVPRAPAPRHAPASSDKK